MVILCQSLRKPLTSAREPVDMHDAGDQHIEARALKTDRRQLTQRHRLGYTSSSESNVHKVKVLVVLFITRVLKSNEDCHMALNAELFADIQSQNCERANAFFPDWTAYLWSFQRIKLSIDAGCSRVASARKLSGMKKSISVSRRHTCTLVLEVPRGTAGSVVAQVLVLRYAPEAI